MSKHVVLKIALSIEPLTAIFRAREGFFAPMYTHVDHVVLADAEYFSTLRKSAPVGLRASMQVKMLVQASFPRKNLHTAFVLALELLIGLAFLRTPPLTRHLVFLFALN